MLCYAVDFNPTTANDFDFVLYFINYFAYLQAAYVFFNFRHNLAIRAGTPEKMQMQQTRLIHFCQTFEIFI